MSTAGCRASPVYLSRPVTVRERSLMPPPARSCRIAGVDQTNTHAQLGIFHQGLMTHDDHRIRRLRHFVKGEPNRRGSDCGSAAAIRGPDWPVMCVRPAAALLVASGAVAQLVPRIGARPLLLAGSAAAAGGLYWLSQISEHDSYTSGVLGPTMVIGAGTALLFVTLSLSRSTASPKPTPASPPACSTPASKSAAPSAWR